MGLNSDETEDFVTYWSENLPYSPCYLIYPQFNEVVDRQVELIVTPTPDSVLRLWLAMDRVENCKELQAPQPVVFERNGFAVVEWGVVMR